MCSVNSRQSSTKMATMIKEKPREKKKKPKQRPAVSHLSNFNAPTLPVILEDDTGNESAANISQIFAKESPSKPSSIENPILETTVAQYSSTARVSQLENQASSNECNMEQPGTSTKDEVSPSAPPMVMDPFVEETPVNVEQKSNVSQNVEVGRRVKFMSIEEVERLFGGVEIAEVRMLSEQEEALIEGGPSITPEHPLVDLLTTFRRSLIAVDRKRIEIARGYAEEQKFRLTLWNIEKCKVYISEKCKCEERVTFERQYEKATFFKEKLPAAKMKLEVLLRDVQQSYCHHQHEALLTYWQIEGLIHEIMQNESMHVREALSLILEAYRASDTGPTALSAALQRWARALTARLLRESQLSDLLFLLHHLFRQARSVRWASQLVKVSTCDMSDAARAVALLDILLTASRRPRLEPAMECTEETDEVWEEVDAFGGAGAVSDGAMRERDLLALLYRMPLRALLARLASIRREDIENMTEYEWGDASGGHAVLKCACGVRYLLAVLWRGARCHTRYAQLSRALSKLAVYALSGLADLNEHTRLQYSPRLIATIEAEIEACVLLGWTLLSLTKVNLHRLPYSVLTNTTARIICKALTKTLHESKATPIEGLDHVEIPAGMECSVRVRIATQIAIDRVYDYELAGFVLSFLLPLALNRKTACKGLCELASRSMLPRLLAAHPQLYHSAFHTFADLYRADNAAVSYIESVSPSTWRPSAQEALNVLTEFAERCSTLLPHLLLTLDCTPYSGLSLESQLAIGDWLCQYTSNIATDAPEWAWQVLRRLRPHRTWWRGCLEVPPPANEPRGLFCAAHALLATAWGHSIPLICEFGVNTVEKLVSVARSRDATHCLGRLMVVMAQSPESIAYTPKFGVVRSALLDTGPSLVQRALGLGGTSGAALLTRLLTQQLTITYKELDHRTPRNLLVAWLQFLAPVKELSTNAAPLLEAALVCCRQHNDAMLAFDQHLALLLQDETAKAHLATLVRNHATIAPTVCEAALRTEHAERELRTALWPRLLQALDEQRRASKRIHVDNAIKSIVQYRFNAEDLVIHKTAAALQAVSTQHPAHLLLWRLFFLLYLQRPAASVHETTPPIGPLFFSGVMKSRILGQLRKKLTEAANFHHSQAKSIQIDTTKNVSSKQEAPTSVQVASNDLLPVLTIDNLTGESSESDHDSTSELTDSDDELTCRSKSSNASDESLKKFNHMKDYHEGAEKAVREYIHVLEEGEKTRVSPHHADLARFIPQHALDIAWALEMERYTSTVLSVDDDSQGAQKTRVMRRDSKTPLQRVLTRLATFRLATDRPSKVPQVRASLDGADIKNSHDLLKLLNKLLQDITTLSTEWTSEINRVSTLDGALWNFVVALRERRYFGSVTKSCSKNCGPIVVVPPREEDVPSPGAERAVAENRLSAQGALRRLARPRPQAARIAASVHALACAVRDPTTALSALEFAWRCTHVDHLSGCTPAKDVITALVTTLAERWICGDKQRCTHLLSRWCNQDLNPLQLSLTGALVEPRRLHSKDLPDVYRAVLHSKLPPHTIFSRLSKFEMNTWAEIASADLRRELTESVTATALSYGPHPPENYSMLIELLDVHLLALLRAGDLPAHATRCIREATNLSWPRALWTHVLKSADLYAHMLTADQICGMLRDIGVIWWEARMQRQDDAAAHEQYLKDVAQVARFYSTCARAAVTAMRNSHSTNDLAAWYAWSATSEAWGAWLLPCSAPPLLPISGPKADAAAWMLKEFTDTLTEVVRTCPGGEARLLQEAWLWSCSACAAAASAAGATARLELLALLGEMSRLPWADCKWFHARCMNVTLQMCRMSPEEKTWACIVLRGVDAPSWLVGVPEENLAAHLAAMLYVVSALPLHEETLKEITRLPWSRLPLVALETELERFFLESQCHASYHALPQFKVLVAASEVYMPSSGAWSESGRDKRLCLVLHWVRACASSRTPTPHVADAAAAMLVMCNAIYGDLDPKNEYAAVKTREAEEFLHRVVALLGAEPGSSVAVPAWLQWSRDAPAHLVEAALGAAATLTAREPFAALGDALLQAHLSSENGNWSVVANRWAACGWHEAAWLAARGRLLAAYGTSLARAHSAKEYEDTFVALAQIKLDFNENEVASAVWICRAGRAVLEEAREALAGGSGGAGAGSAAEALLAAWAEPPPVHVSLIRALSRATTGNRPTAKLRALCRFAQCVISGGAEDSVRAFDAAYASAVSAKQADVTAWTKNPQPRMLPALAQRLYPQHGKYFDKEMEFASGQGVATP